MLPFPLPCIFKPVHCDDGSTPIVRPLVQLAFVPHWKKRSKLLHQNWKGSSGLLKRILKLPLWPRSESYALCCMWLTANISPQIIQVSQPWIRRSDRAERRPRLARERHNALSSFRTRISTPRLWHICRRYDWENCSWSSQLGLDLWRQSCTYASSSCHYPETHYPMPVPSLLH